MDLPEHALSDKQKKNKTSSHNNNIAPTEIKSRVQTSNVSLQSNKSHIEDMSIRRQRAGVYTNSAAALNKVAPELITSLQRSGILQLPSVSASMLSTDVLSIDRLSTEEIEANVIIDEKELPVISNECKDNKATAPITIHQHTHITAGVAVTASPKCEVNVAALTAQLKSYYQKYDNKIIRIFGQPLDLGDCFVNLAIVKNEEQKQNEKDLLKIHPDRSQIYSSYEDIYSTKEKEVILPPDIFKKRDNNIPKRLAIIGRAGIGKSTLAQYLCAHEWAVNNRWEDKFDAVIKIKLRNLTKEHYNKNPTLADIIIVECTDNSGTTIVLDKANIEITLKAITEKTLVILDGWDEFNMKESPCAKTISDLMKSSTLSIIILSRPYTNLNPKEFDLILECIGFATENIPQYINKVCEDKSQVPLIISFLRNNPPIHSLAHIPIILDMICEVWDEEMRASIEPMTMTALYNKMIAKLWKAYMEKQEEQNPGISEDKLLEKKEKAKEFLCLLAFKAMENNTISLSYQLIESTIKTIYKCSDEDVERKLKEILAAGFLNTSNNKFLRGDYYFPHLTFQEFFAAKYLVTQGIEAITTHLNNHASDSRYEFMYTLVAGLLNFEKNDPLDLSERYFQFFSNKIKSHIDANKKEDRQTLFVFMRSLEENKFDAKEAASGCWLFIYVLIVRPLMHNATLMDRKSLITYLKNSPTFCKQLDIVARLTGALPYIHGESNQYAIQVINVLNDVNFILEKIETCKIGSEIHNFLESLSLLANRANANIIAINLIEILKKPILFNIYSNQDVFKDIVLFLKSLIMLDNNILEKYKSEINPAQFHNLFIIKILEYYKQYTANDVLIKTHTTNLNNPNSSFRQLAAESLIELNCLSEELFKVLIKNLNDEDSAIRLGAFNILKRLNKIDDTVFEIFVHNLSKTNHGIRESALEAIEKLGKLNDQKVIDAHSKNLSNESSGITEFAIKAINKLDQINDHIIDRLFELYQNEQYLLKLESIKCLAHFIKTNNKISKKFTTILNDKDSDKYSMSIVIKALGSLDKMDETAISSLINFLNTTESNKIDEYSCEAEISAINIILKFEINNEDAIRALIKKICPPNDYKERDYQEPEDVGSYLTNYKKILSTIINIISFLGRSKNNEDYVITSLINAIKSAKEFYHGYVNDKQILDAFIKTASKVLSELYNLSPHKLSKYKEDIMIVTTDTSYLNSKNGLEVSDSQSMYYRP